MVSQPSAPSFPADQPPAAPPAPVPTSAPTPRVESVVVPKKRKLVSWLIGGLVILVLVVAGSFVFSQLTAPKTVPLASLLPTIIPLPTAVTTPGPLSEPGAGWATYKAASFGFEFRYPSNYQIEEREKGFWVIIVKGGPPQEGMMLDARLSGSYVSYRSIETLISQTITISEANKVGDWMVYRGKVKEGMGKGLEIYWAIIPYKTGAIGFETFTSAPYGNDFKQILATFKFVD